MMITGERRTIVKTAFTLMVFIAFSWGAADVQVRVRGCRKHYSGSGIHHADHLPTNIDRGQQTACRHYSGIHHCAGSARQLASVCGTEERAALH